MCDEMERSVHDALCVVRRVLESKTVVVGGGAVEAALSIYLENFATSLVSYISSSKMFAFICFYNAHLSIPSLSSWTCDPVLALGQRFNSPLSMLVYIT